jgi:hypothetical protein
VTEYISLTEAVERESELVFKRLEPRMMIAVELARRDAIRNGRDQLETIGRNEQVDAIFREAITEGSRAGLGWIALDSAFNAPGSGVERVREHCERTREKAKRWFVSIVARLVPGLRLKGTL